jgi:hypothetical protein
MRASAKAAVSAPVQAPASAAGPALAPSRRAVAAMVAEAEPAGPEPAGLPAVLLTEVRAALRGCTAADLVAVVGAPPAAVDSALAALAARGMLVMRGARWFTA